MAYVKVDKDTLQEIIDLVYEELKADYQQCINEEWSAEDLKLHDFVLVQRVQNVIDEN
jgi:hypothetical protein